VSNTDTDDTSSSWFEQLEAKLNQQLEAFLRANPAQEALLQDQEQQERDQRLRQRRQELTQQADALRAELLQQAAMIQQWQGRVQRARQAGADDLAVRAEAHVATLMDQGRQRWQLLEALGQAYAELELTLQQDQQRQQASTATGAGGHTTGSKSGTPSTPDLEQAWARFEAEQELEVLRRRQRS
jgi:hercynine metabolism protein